MLSLFTSLSGGPPTFAGGPMAIISICIISWFLISSLLTWWPLRHIPGPFSAKFTHLWPIKVILRYTQIEDYRALPSKYSSSLVRVGPKALLTGDIEVWKRINGARSAYTRDLWYQGFKFSGHDNVISLLDTAAHDELKARTARTYSGLEGGVDVEAGVDAAIRVLIAVIGDRYMVSSSSSSAVEHPEREDDGGVSLSQLASEFTLDVITQVGYGKRFGFLEYEGDLHQYHASWGRLEKALLISGEHPIFRLVRPWLMIQPTDKTGFGRVLGVSHDIIRDRFAGKNTKSKDMLNSFMRNGLSRLECEVETFLTILAGSETSSGTIKPTLIFILRTPRIYYRLKCEILKAVDEGAVSFPITVEQAKKLPYLQAVINEGLRLYPPPAPGLYKVVPPGGDMIDGKFVPAGMAVGANWVAMMRDTDIFGNDVDTFRPERFIECTEVQRIVMERAVDIIFSWGRWQCPGKHIARTELHKVYFELLRHFDLSLSYPKGKMVHNYVSKDVHKDVNIKFTKV